MTSARPTYEPEPRFPRDIVAALSPYASAVTLATLEHQQNVIRRQPTVIHGRLTIVPNHTNNRGLR